MKALHEFSDTLTGFEQDRTTLHLRRGSLNAEIQEVRIQIRNNPSQGNITEVRARTLLGRGGAESEPSTMDRLAGLLDQLSMVEKAIAILDADIDTEKRAASVRLCASVRDQEIALGSDVAKTMAALNDKFRKYYKFRDELDATGAITSSLPRLPDSSLGRWSDNSGGYHWFFKEALEAGYIAKANIPEVFR